MDQKIYILIRLENQQQNKLKKTPTSKIFSYIIRIQQ